MTEKSGKFYLAELKIDVGTTNESSPIHAHFCDFEFLKILKFHDRPASILIFG